MSIAKFFLPQLRRQVAKKFNVDGDTITNIVFLVNKADNTIILECHTTGEALKTSISQDEVSIASDSVEKAIKKYINGTLVAYQLTIDMKQKTFNAVLFCMDEKGHKIALPINNIL